MIHIVTAANSRYFSLVLDWATSVRRSIDAIRPDLGPGIEFRPVVLDIGLRDYEVNALAPLVSVIPVTETDFASELGADVQNARSLIGFLDRCRLPAVIGAMEADAVIWMDADAYVHEAEALADWAHLLTNGRAFVVPEIDRAYAVNPHHLTISHGWSVGNYTKFFGAEVAGTLSRLPMINSGVMGAPVAHPLWAAWESATRFALDHNKGRPDFGIDQIALNFAVYLNTDPATVVALDSSYNWCTTHAAPVADPEGRLCHPLWPHVPLKVIHLLDNLKWNRTGVQRVSRDLAAEPRGGDATHLDFATFGQHRRTAK